MDLDRVAKVFDHKVFDRARKFIKDFSLFIQNTESKDSNVAKTKNGRVMLLSKCAVCDRKKSKFIKQQETNGLLSSLGI